MPDAIGSKLPAWPALSARNTLRACCSAALEEIPVGLSSNRMPSTSRSKRRTLPVGIDMRSRFPIVVVVNALRFVAFHRVANQRAHAGALFDQRIGFEVNLRRMPQSQGAAERTA